MESTYHKWHNETKYFNYYANLILYCITLIPFMGLAGVEKLVGDAAFSVLQSAAAVILGLMVIFKARKLRRNRFVILYVVFQGLIFARSVISYGFNAGIFVVVCVGIFLVVLMQKDAAVIVRALTIVAVISLLVNFLYIFVLGADQRGVYFIGGKNAFSIFLVPMCFVVMVNSLLRKGRITQSALAVLILSILAILWGGSGTGIITAVAMVFMLLWIRKNKPNPAVWMIVVVAVYIILVFFLETLSGTSLWNNIMELLGKDSTLTSRVGIWEKVLSLLEGNWAFGVGRGTKIRYTSRWGYKVVTTEAHNFLLELVLEGGIVAACLYAWLIWSVVKEMDMDSKLHRLVFCGFAVMMVNGLAEAINNQMVLTIMLGLMFACANKGICERKLWTQELND